MTDLNSIDGAQSNMAVAISNNGLVAGTSGDRAFAWQNGVMRELSGRADGYTSAAVLIGPDGRIGGYTEGEGYRYAVYWDSAGGRHPLGAVSGPGSPHLRLAAFNSAGLVVNVPGPSEYGYRTIWYRDGGETVLPFFAVHLDETHAVAMNRSGLIVGRAYHHAFRGDRWFHPFVLENGTMLDLGTGGFEPCPDAPETDCSEGNALGVNDRGEVIVSSFRQSFAWLQGVMRDLGDVVPGERILASLINNAGQIAGYAVDGQSVRAFRLTGTTVEFMTLALGDVITAMNERGDIVGAASNPAMGGLSEAFIWRGGVVTFLGCFPWNSSGVRACHAQAVNDHGDVVGWNTSGATGVRRALLWTVR